MLVKFLCGIIMFIHPLTSSVVILVSQVFLNHRHRSFNRRRRRRQLRYYNDHYLNSMLLNVILSALIFENSLKYSSCCSMITRKRYFCETYLCVTKEMDCLLKFLVTLICGFYSICNQVLNQVKVQ